MHCQHLNTNFFHSEDYNSQDWPSYAILLKVILRRELWGREKLAEQLETVDAVQILFRQEVPEGFLRFIAGRQKSMYEEALAHCRENPRLKAPEISALAGHTKRAFFEALARDAAEANGLECSDEMHAGQNLGFVSVRSGRFCMTAHRVLWPGEFVRPSVSRSQAAAVNDYVGQLCIQFGGHCPYPRLAEAEQINVYLLHGDREKGSSFLQVAVPDANLTKYHWNLSLETLMQGYLQDSRKQVPSSEPVEDKRTVKAKKQGDDKKHKKGGGAK